MPDDRFLHRRAGHSCKVNLLTDLEYRVWTQYLLTADDFGIMRASAVTLQADNDHLAGRPPKMVQRCIEALIKAGLVREFEHQGRRYLYQPDWQSWQKVEYPRATTEPAPPPDAIAGCDEPTRELFGKHPGGSGRKRRERSPNVPQTIPEESPTTRAGAPAKRLTATANGYGERQTADGDSPPIDAWTRELVDRYPSQGRCGWNLVERPLFGVLMEDPAVNPWEAWERLKARLDAHKASYQWRVKAMIPRLDRWLRDGLYRQELPAEAPQGERLAPKTNRTLEAAMSIMREGS